VTGRTKTAILFASISFVLFAIGAWHDDPGYAAGQRSTANHTPALSPESVGPGDVALAAPFIAPALGLDRFMDCPSSRRGWERRYEIASKSDLQPIVIDCGYDDEKYDIENAL